MSSSSQTAGAASWHPPTRPGLVVTNPPYGERIGREAADLETSWRDLGAFLKRECAGATAWVLCGHPSLSRHLRLRTARRVPVMNGPIECRWLRYELHEGRGAATEADR